MGRLIDVLHQNLNDPGTSWSIGTFGALGEFFWDSQETKSIQLCDAGGDVVTGRGALSVRISPDVRMLPYEQLSKRPDLWQQGANFCLPDAQARQEPKAVLTELGPDSGALREKDRNAVLFDLGLDTPTLSACVRTDNQDLLAVLRQHVGKSIFDGQNLAMKAIKNKSPHRVFISQLGRVEVYQYIAPVSGGLPVPEGPHTHIQPKLLKEKKTHPINVPMLKGYLPGLSMYPANPMLDQKGSRRSFDTAAHQAFQAVLGEFGPSGIAKLKQQVRQAVQKGRKPSDALAPDRWSRATVKVTLRQLAAEGVDTNAIRQWREYFEPVSDAPDFKAAGT